MVKMLNDEIKKYKCKVSILLPSPRKKSNETKICDTCAVEFIVDPFHFKYQFSVCYFAGKKHKSTKAPIIFPSNIILTII
mmetsp:Transcript_25037/g.30790  ORF Transcript_25037/g.30790 Transcript_25037/m.30790 type:complete len:80 (+) Transcript_25037:1595-1834(+)